jgi:hypothetical protein
MTPLVVAIFGALLVDHRSTRSQVYGALPEMPPEWEELWLKLSRPLNAHELSIGREAFGDTIPWDLVRVIDSSRSLKSSSYVRPRMLSRYYVVRIDEDAQKEHLWSNPYKQTKRDVLFIHELAHVYQLASRFPGASWEELFARQLELGYDETDRYNWKPRVKYSMPWNKWPIEAQAEFIAEAWALSSDEPGAVVGPEYIPYLAALPVQPDLRVGEKTESPIWDLTHVPPLGEIRQSVF